MIAVPQNSNESIYAQPRSYRDAAGQPDLPPPTAQKRNQKNRSVYGKWSTFHLREAEIGAPLQYFSPPHVANYAYTYTLHCDLNAFQNEWNEALDHVADTVGDAAEYGDPSKRQLTVTFSMKSEELLLGFLNTGITYKNQQIPLQRLYAADDQVLSATATDLPATDAVTLTKALIETFSQYGTVLDTAIHTIGKGRIFVRRADIIILPTSTSTLPEVFPSRIQVINTQANVYWKQKRTACRICKQPDHQTDDCTNIRKRFRQNNNRPTDQQAEQHEDSAPPSVANGEDDAQPATLLEQPSTSASIQSLEEDSPQDEEHFTQVGHRPNSPPPPSPKEQTIQPSTNSFEVLSDMDEDLAEDQYLTEEEDEDDEMKDVDRRTAPKKEAKRRTIGELRESLDAKLQGRPLRKRKAVRKTTPAPPQSNSHPYTAQSKITKKHTKSNNTGPQPTLIKEVAPLMNVVSPSTVPSTPLLAPEIHSAEQGTPAKQTEHIVEMVDSFENEVSPTANEDNPSSILEFPSSATQHTQTQHNESSMNTATTTSTTSPPTM
ncbi:hypothetical protein BDF22DRAFT_661963, partial [Syncephalis plumigaleata]